MRTENLPEVLGVVEMGSLTNIFRVRGQAVPFTGVSPYIFE